MLLGLYLSLFGAWETKAPRIFDGTTVLIMSYRNHVYGLKSLLKSVVDARTNKILLTIKWKKCEHGFSKLLRTYYRIVIPLRSFQYFQVDQEQFV